MATLVIRNLKKLKNSDSENSDAKFKVKYFSTNASATIVMFSIESQMDEKNLYLPRNVSSDSDMNQNSSIFLVFSEYQDSDAMIKSDSFSKECFAISWTLSIETSMKEIEQVVTEKCSNQKSGFFSKLMAISSQCRSIKILTQSRKPEAFPWSIFVKINGFRQKPLWKK